MVSDRLGGRHFGAIVGMGLMGSAVGSAQRSAVAHHRHHDTARMPRMPVLI
jgi:hypothetical protein